ncbi:beta-1,3-galactosyltransferase 5-like [Spea bombifrons]|uniref:beta-1,3-galactosyltransferase 5-like n=1 Tax=Spea bombifrons TaxID=233779 RepID=UPI002349C100|nr:beta-1,3-galactosyltransferase 5-like [Spea bombifrons]
MRPPGLNNRRAKRREDEVMEAADTERREDEVLEAVYRERREDEVMEAADKEKREDEVLEAADTERREDEVMEAADTERREDEGMIRRRRSAIVVTSLLLTLVLSLLAWIEWEEESLVALPDILHPLPANLSSPPSFRRSATLYDTNFRFHLNLTEYSQTYPALQTYRCRAVIGLFGYCWTHDPLIILAVKSHPASFGRRNVLRETWAKERSILGYRFKPLFLMANSGRSAQMKKAISEAVVFGDIILWDFMESHHNLSLKERCFLEWLYHRCPQASYVFKGDDDEFVNPITIANYISFRFPLYPYQIHGHLQEHASPERWGKYRVPISVYPHGYYPPFVSGGGFLFPGELIPSLYWAASAIPVFPLDDVFVGFLALAANVTFHHEPSFRSFGLKTDKICKYLDAVVVHGLTPQRMLEIWKDLPNATPCAQSEEEEETQETKAVK